MATRLGHHLIGFIMMDSHISDLISTTSELNSFLFYFFGIQSGAKILLSIKMLQSVSCHTFASCHLFSGSLLKIESDGIFTILLGLP